MSPYAGGQSCDDCGATGLGAADRYCRWCGSKLRDLEAFETSTKSLRQGGTT